MRGGHVVCEGVMWCERDSHMMCVGRSCGCVRGGNVVCEWGHYGV